MRTRKISKITGILYMSNSNSISLSDIHSIFFFKFYFTLRYSFYILFGAQISEYELMRIPKQLTVEVGSYEMGESGSLGE
jgi:hypothetical protein